MSILDKLFPVKRGSQEPEKEDFQRVAKPAGQPETGGRPSPFTRRQPGTRPSGLSRSSRPISRGELLKIAGKTPSASAGPDKKPTDTSIFGEKGISKKDLLRVVKKASGQVPRSSTYLKEIERKDIMERLFTDPKLRRSIVSEEQFDKAVERAGRRWPKEAKSSREKMQAQRCVRYLRGLKKKK